MNFSQVVRKKFLRGTQVASLILRTLAKGEFKQGFEFLCRGSLLVLATLIPPLQRFLKSYPNAEETRAFDARFGVDTSTPVKVSQMEVRHEHAINASYYQASSPKLFKQALANLGPICYPDFTLIDCGSGKGIALLLASEFPFRRIIGIEFAANLHRVALENIQKFSSQLQQCRSIQSYCADVTTFDFPVEPIVFYLYNPFDACVMERFLNRVEASWRSAPRPIFFIYVEPLFASVFDAKPFLHKMAEVKSIPTQSYTIYQMAPLI
ncbi:MAG: class I SAM-dependent methyltransferase [Verrucomicrobiota bacterium]